MLVFVFYGHYQDVFLMSISLLSGTAPHNSALSGEKSVWRESFQAPSSTWCLWGSKLAQCGGKHVGGSFKTVKIELMPDIPILLGNRISRSKRHLWHLLQLLQHYSLCLRHRIKINTHQFNEQRKHGHIYPVNYYSAIKRMEFCNLQQHGWSWRLFYWMKQSSGRKTIWHGSISVRADWTWSKRNQMWLSAARERKYTGIEEEMIRSTLWFGGKAPALHCKVGEHRPWRTVWTRLQGWWSHDNGKSRDMLKIPVWPLHGIYMDHEQNTSYSTGVHNSQVSVGL